MNSGAPTTRKKVVIRKLDKGLIKGYVNSSEFPGPSAIEVLDRDGRLVGVPIDELKGVFFVREFDGNPQRLERKTFQSRPKHCGLWVRLTFRDNEVLEGIIANNLLELDPRGFFLAPPDAYSNNLKVFIPRSAMTSFEVLGVISDAATRRGARRGPGTRRPARDASAQIGLFSPPAAQSEAKQG